jgi:PKD repeat protein
MQNSGMFRLFLVTIVAALLIGAACDKLITEENTVTLIDSTLGVYCLDCHAGDNNNKIIQPRGQWTNSDHASHALIEATVSLNGVDFVTNECGPACHTSEGYVAAVEPGQPSDVSRPTVIGCYTCHRPHTGAYGTWDVDSLRGYDSELPLEMTNGKFYELGKSKMCVHCHQAVNAPPTGVGTVTLTGDWGPHKGAQADVVSGTGGSRFGVINDTLGHWTILTSDGCLACHFGTGLGYEFGEHTFRLQNDTTGAQYLENCYGPGCHPEGSLVDLYDSAVYPILGIIDSLADTLGNALVARGFLDPSDPDRRSFYAGSQIPGKTAELLYNYLLYTTDGSNGLHNPALMLQLLAASVDRLDSIPPTAAFAVSADTVCINSMISFTDQSIGNFDTYRWDFGDDLGTSGLPNPNYVYDRPGDFLVSLIIEGPVGLDTANAGIRVNGPLAQFSAPTLTGCSTLTVTFTDESVGADSWAWDFGDGVGTSTEASPEYTYDNPGRYTVTLTVTDSCGSHELVKPDYIVVYSGPPTAAFVVDATTGTTSTEFNFTDQSIDADTWAWDFDDGETSDEQNPVHTFADTGIYTVELIVTNACSGADTASVTITIN